MSTQQTEAPAFAKVRFITSMATAQASISPGDIVRVNDFDTANSLVRGRCAEVAPADAEPTIEFDPHKRRDVRPGSTGSTSPNQGGRSHPDPSRRERAKAPAGENASLSKK